MKRILMLLVLIMTLCGTAIAQTQWYKTTAYAEATVLSTGRYIWSDWQSSNMNICFNLGTDTIIIYSPRRQVYTIYDTYNNGNAYVDNSGGQNVKFYVIDQDGDLGEIRLRIERNGNSQIYVDFSNVAWVYNVTRIE